VVGDPLQLFLVPLTHVNPLRKQETRRERGNRGGSD
jgi:hypothetical protein